MLSGSDLNRSQRNYGVLHCFGAVCKSLFLKAFFYAVQCLIDDFMRIYSLFMTDYAVYFMPILCPFLSPIYSQSFIIP